MKRRDYQHVETKVTLYPRILHVGGPCTFVPCPIDGPSAPFRRERKVGAAIFTDPEEGCGEPHRVWGLPPVSVSWQQCLVQLVLLGLLLIRCRVVKESRNAPS